MSWLLRQQAPNWLVGLLARDRTTALTTGWYRFRCSHGGGVGIIDCTNQFRSKRPDKTVANRAWNGPPSPFLHLRDERCVLRISRARLQTLKHQPLPPLQQYTTIIQLDRQHIPLAEFVLGQ